MRELIKTSLMLLLVFGFAVGFCLTSTLASEATPQTKRFTWGAGIGAISPSGDISKRWDTGFMMYGILSYRINRFLSIQSKPMFSLLSKKTKVNKIIIKDYPDAEINQSGTLLGLPIGLTFDIIKKEKIIIKLGSGVGYYRNFYNFNVTSKDGKVITITNSDKADRARHGIGMFADLEISHSFEPKPGEKASIGACLNLIVVNTKKIKGHNIIGTEKLDNVDNNFGPEIWAGISLIARF
jgi:hypothetical protein